MSNTTKFLFQRIKHFVGFPASGHHLSEQLVATLGGVISISLVILVTRALVGEQAALVIVPSLGASAVLIFAAPHSPFAQPWAVLGGHLLSALVGVACWKLVPNATLAAGLAVGLAIGVMHLARCLHPPGGATALAAVIGGAAVHDLGFRYALNPIALNCAIILDRRRRFQLCLRLAALPGEPDALPRRGSRERERLAEDFRGSCQRGDGPPERGHRRRPEGNERNHPADAGRRPETDATPNCRTSSWAIITATTVRASSGRCARSSTSGAPTIRNSTS